MSWQGKVAFITGGTRGIGASLCEQLLAEGARVYSCGRSGTGFPNGVVGFACDVSNADNVARVVAAIADSEDRLDLLVNNAGVLGPRKTLENVSLEDWREVFAVNADGPFLVTRESLALLRAGRGTVVNISSSVGRKGRGSWGPYACSKHALEGMTDVFADELKDDDVAVISVNPGGTATDMRADAFPDEDPATLPDADAVAAVILQLAERRETGGKFNVRDMLPSG